MLLLGAAAGVALLAVAVVVAFGSGGSGSPTTTTAATSTGSGKTEAQTIFTGVPQHGDTVGKASAEATLFVYEDPQCPYCRDWDVETLPTVMRDYVRTGKLQLVYRGIAIVGPNSVAGLRGNYAAGLQNRLWNMVTAMYERQGEENSGWITIPVITDAATEAGADPDQVIKDADTAKVTAMLEDAQADAAAKEINGTPTFVLQKPLGEPEQLNVTGIDPASFTATLDAALQ